MKIEELKIGNLVLKNKELICFRSDTLATLFNEPKYINLYEPIKLSENWMNIFDFKKVVDKIGIYEKENVRLGLGNGALIYLINADTKESHYIKPVNYVHQLQNVFAAITDIELKIK